MAFDLQWKKVCTFQGVKYPKDVVDVVVLGEKDEAWVIHDGFITIVYLDTGVQDEGIYVWETEDIYQVDLSRDRTTLATFGETFALVPTRAPEQMDIPEEIYGTLGGAVFPDGRKAIVVIKYMDGDKDWEEMEYVGFGGTVMVIFDKDDPLSYMDDEKTLTLHDYEQGMRTGMHYERGHEPQRVCIKVSPDGKRAFWVERDVAILDASTLNRVRVLKNERNDPLMKLYFLDGGNAVVGIGGRGTITTWDVTTGKETGYLKLMGVRGKHVVQHDGNVFATLIMREEVQFWDVKKGAMVGSAAVPPKTQRIFGGVESGYLVIMEKDNTIHAAKV